MSRTRPHTSAAETRERILDAADARFRRYGYTKTTMAEIANDTGMSAANLYRYFENKRDIAASLALRCFEEKDARLRAVVERTDIGPADKIEAFLLELLRYTFSQCDANPKLNALVEDIASHRPDIVARKRAGEQALMAEILVEGVRRGEFAVDDIEATARTVMASSLMFGLPLLMHTMPLEEFESLARRLARLLVRGLTRGQE